MSDENTQYDNIIVSFDDVKMKDFRAYWTAVAKGDWKGQDEFFAKVVKSWDYEYDSSDPASYENLAVEEYNAVQVSIRQASKSFSDNLVQQKDKS